MRYPYNYPPLRTKLSLQTPYIYLLFTPYSSLSVCTSITSLYTYPYYPCIRYYCYRRTVISPSPSLYNYPSSCTKRNPIYSLYTVLFFPFRSMYIFLPNALSEALRGSLLRFYPYLIQLPSLLYQAFLVNLLCCSAFLTI
jgi:hypothetical protein